MGYTLNAYPIFCRKWGMAMFLFRRNETQRLMKQLKENNYKSELAARDRQISMLEVERELKKCMIAVNGLREAVDRWQK